MKIKAVTLFFPLRDDGEILIYEVGKKGITKIVEKMYFPAEYCSVTYYDVYKNNECIASIHHYSLVEYF